MTKYLKILRNSDIFPKIELPKPKKYEKRYTVKAIVLNNKGQVALVTNPIHKFLILPGGGAESANLKKEITRECREEIQQEIEIIKTIGVIKEFRDRDAREYITTCFAAKAVRKVGADLRTNEEIKNGLRVVWVSKKKLKDVFEKQNKKVEAGKVNFYNIAFNIVRDRIFINEWLKTIEF